MGAFSDAVEYEEPTLPSELAWLWRAWWRLTDSRSWLSGMSTAIPLPIPFRDLIEWSNFHGYDDDMFHQLDEVCKAMDGVYIAHMQAKAKA